MHPAALPTARGSTVMPDDHSQSVPPLPIPNRTVKRLRANDSADSRVKVGHRQAVMQVQPFPVKKQGRVGSSPAAVLLLGGLLKEF